MSATIRVILGDPGSAPGHPTAGDAANAEVIAAGLIPGVILPGVQQINIRTGRGHPADEFPGGQATVTVDVAQLGTTDMVRDITARLIEATLEPQTGRRLPKAWQPADSLVEFVTIIADITWLPADRSQTALRAWWPLFSGNLRRTTRTYGRTGQDLLTLDIVDSSVWLGASTGVPIAGTFTAWPQESIVDRVERILTQAVYPTNRLTGGVVDPATTPQPDGSTPRKRRVRISEPTTQMVASIAAAPPGSLLAEARETVFSGSGDLFWHHGIGDIVDRDAKPDTTSMPSGVEVQTDWADLLVLAGATLDPVAPSVTRSGFASPVIFGSTNPNTRTDGTTTVTAAYSVITDQIDASKTTSVTRWARIGGNQEIRASQHVSQWIRRLGWRTSERTETLHATDSDRQLAQEYFEHEHVRPRRIWQWEVTNSPTDPHELATERQLAQAMTSIRHRISLAVPQSGETHTTGECHIEQVTHRITPITWTTSYTGVPASTSDELRGWGRDITRRNMANYGTATAPPATGTSFSPPAAGQQNFISMGITEDEMTLWSIGGRVGGSNTLIYSYDLTQNPPTETSRTISTTAQYGLSGLGSLIIRGGNLYATAQFGVDQLLLTQWPIANPNSQAPTITEPEYQLLPLFRNGFSVDITEAARACRPTETLAFTLILRRGGGFTPYYDIYLDRRDINTQAQTGTPTIIYSETGNIQFHLYGLTATATHLYAHIGTIDSHQIWRWPFNGDNLGDRATTNLPATVIDMGANQIGGLTAVGTHFWLWGGTQYHRLTISDLTFS